MRLTTLITIFLCIISSSAANAFDTYYTVSYRSYSVPGEKGDVVFEKKIIHVSVPDDATDLPTIEIAKAFVDFIKINFPAYVERTKNDSLNQTAKETDKRLLNSVDAFNYRTEEEAETGRNNAIAQARKDGYPIVELRKFNYP